MYVSWRFLEVGALQNILQSNTSTSKFMSLQYGQELQTIGVCLSWCVWIGHSSLHAHMAMRVSPHGLWLLCTSLLVYHTKGQGEHASLHADMPQVWGWSVNTQHLCSVRVVTCKHFPTCFGQHRTSWLYAMKPLTQDSSADLHGQKSCNCTWLCTQHSRTHSIPLKSRIWNSIHRY